MHTYSLYEFVELNAILAKSQEQLRSITRVIKHAYSLLSHPKDNTGKIQTLLQDGPSSPEGIRTAQHQMEEESVSLTHLLA